MVDGSRRTLKTRRFVAVESNLMSQSKTNDGGCYPYLAVKDGLKAVEFYTEILGAEEKFRLTNPEGRVCHSQLHFGDSVVMLAEEFPGYSQAPETVGGTPVRLCLSVPDVDPTMARAVNEGAPVLHAAADKFVG